MSRPSNGLAVVEDAGSEKNDALATALANGRDNKQTTTQHSPSLHVETSRQLAMALELCIRPCIHKPPLCHAPPPDKPLRIHIQGPLETIQKLLRNVSWHPIGPFPQPGGLKLASLTHQKLYRGRSFTAPAVRDEYPACVIEGGIPLLEYDRYR